MKKVEELIVEEIIAAKPNLPSEKITQNLVFNWNEQGLSTWEGGRDLNEETRKKVISLLKAALEDKRVNFRKILIFLLKQEIKDCYESEYLTEGLRVCYNSLASLKFIEDVPLL
ncbi:MAG: hypothetical protein AAGJ18_07205, partial [Bacteroidota bacterium]